jgi:formylglycine-generating enzyme required for sulfatase activity
LGALRDCYDRAYPTIEAYITQYATSEPLWAVRARQRLEVIQALIAEREAARKDMRRAKGDADKHSSPTQEKGGSFISTSLPRWKRGREAAEEAQNKARGPVKVKAWTPQGREQRWITPGAGRDESHVFRDFEYGPEMVIAPKGEFLMGSMPEEIAALTKDYGDHFKDEGPQHRVVIPKPFAIGRNAVTFAEWDVFVAAGRGGYRHDDKGWGRGDRPVIKVSWKDAQAYLTWLSEQSEAIYRLPSEAEWEYAARAGTVTPFWWGVSISTKQANYDGNRTYGGGKKGEYRQKTVPVKSFEANPWGLYQVHGNVWEWCADPWHEGYQGAPADGSVWTHGGDDSRRVLRGGSWGSSPRFLRSADRVKYSSGDRDSDYGFRVARTLNPIS